MNNPILGALNQSRLQPVKQMLQAMRGNPSAMMSQMTKSNPQMAQVMNIIQQHGGDARKAFYSTAEQLGVNGDEILNMLK